MRLPTPAYMLLPILLAAAPAAAQDPPKVVVVVAGDPDDGLRAAAQSVDQALTDAPALATPADPGLRQALRGEPEPDEDDGLGRARAARRSLGLAEDDDIPTLSALGRMTGAAVVAVVRRDDADGFEVVAFDVGRRAFFEGSIVATAQASEIVEFIGSRARAARRAQAVEEAEPFTRTSDDEDAEGGDEPAHGRERDQRRRRVSAPEPEPPTLGEDEEETSFWEDAWPYFVAGALLIGTIVVFTLRSGPDDPPQPVLRFIPGGS